MCGNIQQQINREICCTTSTTFQGHMCQVLSLGKSLFKDLETCVHCLAWQITQDSRLADQLDSKSNLLPAAFGSVQVYKFRSLNSICTSCPYPAVTQDVKAHKKELVSQLWPLQIAFFLSMLQTRRQSTEACRQPGLIRMH